MPSFRLRFPVPWAGILAVALLACHSVTARAQIRVEGPADAVHIDVVNVPLRDVLGTLQTKFRLSYRSNDALDQMKTVKLDAPLRRVVARLLEGYDFVIAITPGAIDVLILQQSVATDSVVTNIVIPRVVPTRAPAPAEPVTTSGKANRYQRD